MWYCFNEKELFELDHEFANMGYISVETTRRMVGARCLRRIIKSYSKLKKRKINEGQFLLKVLENIGPIFEFDKGHRERYKKAFSESAILNFEKDLAFIGGKESVGHLCESICCAIRPENFIIYTLSVGRDLLGISEVDQMLDCFGLPQTINDEEEYRNMLYEIEEHENFAVVTADDHKKISLAFV